MPVSKVKAIMICTVLIIIAILYRQYGGTPAPQEWKKPVYTVEDRV